MLGHWRPLFLRFQKGGKTVATAGGAFLGLAPVVGLIGLVIWIALFVATRYASVASMVTAAALPFVALALGEPWPVVVFAARRRPSRSSCTGRTSRGSGPAPRAAFGCAALKRQAQRSHSASDVCRSRRDARGELAAQLRHGALALGEDVVRVDGLEVDLPREEEVLVVEFRERSSAPLSERRTESSTKRGCRCACSTTNSSSGRFSSS